METVILGSGSFYPDTMGDAVRRPAGYAVNAGQGIMVFDLGYGNAGALARANMPFGDISHVFLSHFHPDHWGDLPALLFAYRYNQKPRGGRLVLAGPKGLTDLLTRIRASSPGHFDAVGYILEIAELMPDDRITACGCAVACEKTDHTPDSLAFKIYGPGGQTLCYTGDAKFSQPLKCFCADAGVIIADAGSCGEPPGSPHMTPQEAAGLSDTAVIYLSHLSAGSAAEAEKLVSRRVRLAYDLHHIIQPVN